MKPLTCQPLLCNSCISVPISMSSSSIFRFSSLILNNPSSLLNFRRLHFSSSPSSQSLITQFSSPFSTSSKPPIFPPPKRNTLVNYSLSDSESNSEPDKSTKNTKNAVETSKLPPPYDPFKKNMVTKESDDKKNLPNAYTYGVLLEGLMESGDEKMVKKIVEEMMKRGIKEEEEKEVLEVVKSKGVVPDLTLGSFERKERESL